MKKIAVFSAYFHPHEGGVEKYVYGLFKKHKNIEVTIITSNTENSKAYEEKDGFKIYRLPCCHIMGKTYPVFKPSAMKTLKELSKQKFDYVVTNTRFFNASWMGAHFASMNKIKLLHIEHGTKHVPLKNPLFRLLAIVYDHTFGRSIFKKSWKVAGISRASEAFVKHVYPRDTVLLNNFIDGSFFHKVKTDFRKKNKLEGKMIITFVGRLIYAKGVQDLINAVKGMADVAVVVIGNGNYRKELENMHAKNVMFLGEKNSNQIREILSASDIFVNPSYAEGLPTSVLEAGAMGVPIIATDVGGTKEIIKDSNHGILVQPKDVKMLRQKLELLMTDKKLRDKMSKNISSYVHKTFDVEVVRKRLESFLK